jgi:hypothetical protein
MDKYVFGVRDRPPTSPEKLAARLEGVHVQLIRMPWDAPGERRPAPGRPKPSYRQIIEIARNGARPSRVSFSTTEARTGDWVDATTAGLPRPSITDQDKESVPGCSLIAGSLDEESLRELEAEGFILRYDGRIQGVSAGKPRPVDEMVARADSTFRLLDAVLPKRLVDEDIGDALEAMNRVAKDPRYKYPRLVIRVRFVVTLVCVALNWVRYVCASVLGKKAE